MRRRFNTAGPCLPTDHYMIPVLSRLPEAPELVDLKAYFVVHAPRQTGKTTALRALARVLTDEGRYAAMMFSCEAAKAAGDDYGAASRIILDRIRASAEDSLPAGLEPPPWPEASAGARIVEALRAWARVCPLPLVLFFDEIDALQGRSLLSVRGQLRDGYNSRPAPFPSSVALCGLRDVRDYKAAAGGDPSRLGTSSPFNIKLESLRLGDFTFDEVAELYGQHTADTGQLFAPGAVERAYELTAGQPWLVNEFADWWIENGEFLTSTGYYSEAAPQLILMGFLQRVVNGGGQVEREYGVGSGRIDLQLRWPYRTPDNAQHVQREAIEIKAWRAGKPNPLRAGLKQLDRHLDRLRLDTGTLALFDQRPGAPAIDERTTLTTTTSPAGRVITLLNG